MKIVIFVFIVAVAAPACFVVTENGVTGAARHIVSAACPASVACMTCGASVMWLCFFIVFCEYFITHFVVNLDVLVVGDVRHEDA